MVDLDTLLRSSLDKHFKQLSQELEWTQLAVKYQSYIDLLMYTLDAQARVANGTKQ